MRRARSSLIVALAGCMHAHHRPSVTVLVYASPYAPTHPFSRADQTWMRVGRSAFGGTLRIRPYWSGALLSSEHSMAELRHGVADIGLITPIYARGGAHLIRAQAGFYGGLDDVRAAVGALSLPRGRRTAVRARAARPEGAGGAGRQPAGDRHARSARSHPRRSCGAAPARAVRAAGRARTSRRRPGRHADGRSVFGAGQGRARRRRRARRHTSSRCTSPKSRVTSTRSRFPAGRIRRARWASAVADADAEAPRSCSSEGIAVWESALASELSAANEAGFAAGARTGVAFYSLSPKRSKRASTQIYARDGEASAARSCASASMACRRTVTRVRSPRGSPPAMTLQCTRG